MIAVSPTPHPLRESRLVLVVDVVASGLPPSPARQPPLSLCPGESAPPVGFHTPASTVGFHRPPGGVDLVMSPQLALCELSSRELSSGGFCQAELASCEPGWILLSRPGFVRARLNTLRGRVF